MTVQMTMEEYKKLEKASEQLEAIKEAIEQSNNFPEDSPYRREKFFNLMNKLSIKVPGYV